MSQHLVFYDGKCGFCDRMVQRLLKVDQEKKFAFAPLEGETAKKLLVDMDPKDRSADSMVLIENFHEESRQYYIRSIAVFRICWLLGGRWKLIGWKCFLPAQLFDGFYALIAKNRHRILRNTSCVIPSPQDVDRFLP